MYPLQFHISKDLRKYLDGTKLSFCPFKCMFSSRWVTQYVYQCVLCKFVIAFQKELLIETLKRASSRSQ